MKLKFLFLPVLLVLLVSSAFASEDFVDSTIQGLLQEKITDNRVTVEQQYNSNNKIIQIKSKKEVIKSIILEKFDPKFSSFRVQVNYNDGKIDTISGKYITYIMAPVAARYIKFGDIIQGSDITSKKMRLDTFKKGFATETSEVIGMQAKKYIAVGRMFNLNDILSPPVLRNNDPVNIIYSSGTISLKTVGIALGAGAVGDMVKVKNTSSGAILLGQIINKNTVQVGGE
jgi:flagella basal body P-ring formation protein FlgA